MVVAGQAPFAVTGVVSGAVVGSAIPAVGVGRKDALQPSEAVVVRRVDEVIARPADRRVKQVTVPVWLTASRRLLYSSVAQLYSIPLGRKAPVHANMPPGAG